MESRLPIKKIQEHLIRIETLEGQFHELVQSEALARRESEQRLMQVLVAQREEIVRLREELTAERQDRRRRRVKAQERFKSE